MSNVKGKTFVPYRKKTQCMYQAQFEQIKCHTHNTAHIYSYVKNSFRVHSCKTTSTSFGRITQNTDYPLSKVTVKPHKSKVAQSGDFLCCRMNFGCIVQKKGRVLHLTG